MHARQRPRSETNDSRGTLSCQAIAAPHPGQAEPGRTRLRPSGSRAITTFRKLPITSPATTKIPIIWPRSSRGHDPGGRKSGRRECSVETERARYGQVAPPLLSAAVLSPLPQSTNVPVALLEYL